jgi:hypothetical protein
MKVNKELAGDLTHNGVTKSFSKISCRIWRINERSMGKYQNGNLLEGKSKKRLGIKLNKCLKLVV